jgi:class 3 adenylate cyclase
MNSGQRERIQRRLAAILAADVAGYSRLMGEDDEGTLAALKAIRQELVDPKIAGHRGPHHQDDRCRVARRVRHRRRCGAVRRRVMRKSASTNSEVIGEIAIEAWLSGMVSDFTMKAGRGFP